METHSWNENRESGLKRNIKNLMGIETSLCKSRRKGLRVRSRDLL